MHTNLNGQTIQIAIRPTTSTIVDYLPPETWDKVYNLLSYEWLGSEYTPRRKAGQWDGRVRLLKKNRSFPTGLTSMVVKALLADGLTPNITCPEYVIPKMLPQIPASYFPYELTLGQIKAVETLVALPPPYRGTIHAPPRSGKTIIAAEAVRRINNWPCIFLCERLDIAQPPRGAVTKFQEYFGDSLTVGYAYDGQFVEGDIMVVTVQTAATTLHREIEIQRGELIEQALDEDKKDRLNSLFKQAPIFIVDESHHACAVSYLAVLEAGENRKYTFGLSGTPFRDDNLDIVMEGAVGPVVYSISYQEMINSGRLVPAEIYLVHMPAKKYPKKTSLALRRSDYIHNNPYRNNIITRFVGNMLEAHRSTMIVVEHTSHLAALYNWLKSANIPVIPMAATGQFKVEPKARQVIWDKLQNKEILCLITTLGQEGIDIPSLDSVVIAAGGKSSIKCLQRFRAMTAWEGKDRCYILDFIDAARYFSEHSNERLSIYTQQPSTVFRLHHIANNTEQTPEIQKWTQNTAYRYQA